MRFLFERKREDRIMSNTNAETRHTIANIRVFSKYLFIRTGNK